MSAVVEVWMSELSKLRDKVEGARKPLFLSRTSREGSQVTLEEGAEETRKERSRVVQKDATLSEDTVVCLLMDRFTPL